jgi:hypothetical protein
MSVATEFAPDVYIPERARTACPPVRLATVTTLHRPDERTVAPPLRLTRRGVLVLCVAVAVLAVALVGFAWLSAPAATAGECARHGHRACRGHAVVDRGRGGAAA